jgi:hypothetical protein
MPLPHIDAHFETRLKSVYVEKDTIIGSKNSSKKWSSALLPLSAMIVFPYKGGEVERGYRAVSRSVLSSELARL